MPKGHALDHILFALRKSAVCRKRSLNPLIFSVQLFEDFIGRVSRAARKASPQQVVKSVLQRCLQASYRHWHAGGFVKDWWFQDKERGKKKNWLRDVCFKGAFEGVYIYIYSSLITSGKKCKKWKYRVFWRTSWFFKNLRIHSVLDLVVYKYKYKRPDTTNMKTTLINMQTL